MTKLQRENRRELSVEQMSNYSQYIDKKIGNVEKEKDFRTILIENLGDYQIASKDKLELPY